MRDKPLVKTPVWIAIVAIVALASIALTVAFSLGKDESTADVYVDGKLVYTVDLSRVDAPYEYELVTPYGVNVLYVQKGEIRIKSADCADELCVRQGVATAGKPVVCLPHRLVVRLRKTGEADEVAR